MQAYLNHLASAEPTPGGGSAATVVGALGAALVAMVARITLGSAKYCEHHADAALLVGDADALRARFVAARRADEEAFAAVTRATALPRAADAEREARRTAIQAALYGAAEAPLHAAALAAELLALAVRAAALRNTNLVSDVECAVVFAVAACAASAANIRINHRFITDTAVVAEQRTRLAAIEALAAERERDARAFFAAD